MLFRKRSSGVLLHITSLPSKFGIGDMGPGAFRFADLLEESKQKFWQILPLTPTSTQSENSPYNSDSAFAGNTLLISPELLVKDKFLSDGSIDIVPDFPSGWVDYDGASIIKGEILKKAYQNFKQTKIDIRDFESFCDESSDWLDDYALYKALSQETGKPWFLWPPHLRDRERPALEEKRRSLRELVNLEAFAQFLFYKQWRSLREYCNSKAIGIIGDLPFYTSYGSVDVWAHPEMFKLDDQKKPIFFSGVPPDYFSKTGQLWGNPVYDWDELLSTHFSWMIARIRNSFRLYDILRLDHFRGFLACWEVPAYEKTAVIGRWVKGPSAAFFTNLVTHFPNIPFIAEDLGVITPDVKEIMDKLDFPGMRVIFFAFGGSSDNPHLPQNHPINSVAYTGTHDTNTAKGWFLNDSNPAERDNLFRYAGRKLSEDEVS